MSQIVDRGTLLKVLDHGYVRIIDFMGKDESIVEAARMSTGKGFISWDPYERCDECTMVAPIGQLPVITNTKIHRDGTKSCGKISVLPNGDLGLLDTLWRKKHATPFEMGELVIEVQAPIFVFREWHRHRTQSFNEFSARYAVMPNLHYVPDASRIQRQSTANKQGSAEQMPEDVVEDFLRDCEGDQERAYIQYEDWVTVGVAKEIARVNTPVSRYSKMRAKGNIRNWFQFLNLRMRPDAQHEIKMFANEVGKIISWLWPKAYQLFEEYDLYGAHFSRTELRMLREMISDIDGCLPANSKLSGTKLSDFIRKLKVGGEEIL